MQNILYYLDRGQDTTERLERVNERTEHTMKKITKAQIKAAPKYVLGIDYKASYKPMTIELKPLKATDLLAAMKEANENWQFEDDDKIWCLSIYENSGKVTEDGEIVDYQDCLTAWSRGRWEVRQDVKTTCKYLTRWNEVCW